MKVNFMIIGAQKCGTTSLAAKLAMHPELSCCTVKEPHFFSTTKDWRKEIDDYHALYQQSENALYFEASTTYTFYPLRNLQIWDDLYAYNPALKFIYVVRKPIDRIVSGYMHTYERGYTNLEIDQAVRKDPLYLDVTRYYTQIAPFIERFGRDRVLLIDFDDLLKNTEAVLEQVTEFVGVSFAPFRGDAELPHENRTIGGEKQHYRLDKPLIFRALRRYAPRFWRFITRVNQRKFSQKPTLDPKLKRAVLDILALEIRELEKLMDKDLGSWRQP